MNKNEILHQLSQNEKIAKCLLSNESDFLNYELKEGDKDKLIWKNIIPYTLMKSIPDTPSSYITMQFQYTKAKTGNVFKIGGIKFFIFCHNSIVRTDYKELRYDYLFNLVDEWISNARSDEWLGNMEFNGMTDMSVEGKDYVGVSALYKSVEFK